MADVEAALAEAELLGSKRRMGPERAPTGLVAGHPTEQDAAQDLAVIEPSAQKTTTSAPIGR